MPPASEILTAALGYSLRGWRVFPIASGRKAPPLFEKWQHLATTDAATINEWWAKWPRSNVGIATGIKSNLVVIDVDPRHDGDTAISNLQNRNGKLPDTVCSVTAGKGQHLYFRYPTNHQVKNSQGIAGNIGIDVRGEGGYVVAPPSRNGSSLYFWDLNPDDHPVAELPTWFFSLCAKDAEEPLIDDATGKIPEGRRHRALVSLAGSLARKALDPATIEVTLRSFYEHSCDQHPPMADQEFARLAADARKWVAEAAAAVDLRKQERAFAITSPDPVLRDAIIANLIGLRHPKGTPALVRRQDAATVLVRWLVGNGGFVRSELDETFYFYRPESRLYRLTTQLWSSWLHSLTGVFPSSEDFKALHSSCVTVALQQPRVPVVRVAAYDAQSKCLRISRFDGTVYRLDGESVAEEPNGAGALFEDDPTWQPFLPDYSAQGSALRHITHGIPSWDESRASRSIQSTLFRTWIIATFLPELCPSRPFLLAVGAAGSGKSMLLRCLLRSLFGERAQVNGVPDKPDGFVAMASSAHVLAIDNLDQFHGWMQDRFARAATGAEDSCRKLYTTNEEQRIRYRCYIAFTARTPDTLKRDDLADRLVLTYTKKIEAFSDDLAITDRIGLQRNAWWGDVISLLNKFVESLRNDSMPTTSTLRMASWELIGRRVAMVLDEHDAWNGAVAHVSNAQAEFVLEESIIVEAVSKWLESHGNHDREMFARHLWEDLARAMWGDKRPPNDWPSSARSFSRRMVQIREALKRHFAITWREDRKRFVLYRISPLNSPQIPDAPLF